LKIIKLTEREQLKNLKRNDRLIVEWTEPSDAYKKGEPITMTRIFGVNHLGEVIVRKRDNLYFNICMFIKGESFAKEVYLIKEGECEI